MTTQLTPIALRGDRLAGYELFATLPTGTVSLGHFDSAAAAWAAVDSLDGDAAGYDAPLLAA